jgi:uncharacterized damage-inducible protein DinB
MSTSPSASAGTHGDTYGFLLDAYETEVLKTAGIWSAFRDDALSFRPAPKSRSVLEQMEHQVRSEARWMATMLGIDTGDPDPAEKTARGYIEQYRSDASRRLETLRSKPNDWWRETSQFFDVPRSRAWIFLRRLNHSTHHRGQLVVYLRILGLRVPSVYGHTADTDGRVIYNF